MRSIPCPFGSGGCSANVDENVAAPSFPGQRAGEAGRLRRQEARGREREAVRRRRPSARALCSARREGLKLHGEDVVDGGAEVTGAELLIALEQEASTEQEHDGERDLRGEKSFA